MTLLGVAKANWRHYLPMWVFFPALFLLTRRADLSALLFGLVVIPIFFGASVWAMLPWLRRTVGYWHSAFWAIVVPVGSWFLLVATAPYVGAT